MHSNWYTIKYVKKSYLKIFMVVIFFFQSLFNSIFLFYFYRLRNYTYQIVSYYENNMRSLLRLFICTAIDQCYGKNYDQNTNNIANEWVHSEYYIPNNILMEIRNVVLNEFRRWSFINARPFKAIIKRLLQH